MTKVRKRISVLVSLMLVVTMLFGVGNVWAEERSMGKMNFVEIASIKEDLGEGLTVVKTLSILATEKNISTYSFVGSKTGRVEHKYIRNNKLKASIMAYAVFQNPSDNKCTIYDKNYSVYNSGDVLNEIFNIGTTTEENKAQLFSSARYSKYTVEYDYSGYENNNKKLWIKCTSNGTLTDSGNKVYSNRNSINSNEVIVDDMVITFG